MREVIVSFKVMPKDAEADLEKVESDIKNSINPDRIKQEPIAFGLVALKVVKIVPDAGGEVDSIEEKLRKIEGVGEVEVTDLTKTL